MQVQHFGLRHRLRILKRTITESINVGAGFIITRIIIKPLTDLIEMSTGFVFTRILKRSVGDGISIGTVTNAARSLL